MAASPRIRPVGRMGMVCAAMVTGLVAAAHADARAGAHVAGNVMVNDDAKLHLVSGNGEVLLEEGAAAGSLPGSARVVLDVGADTATSSFTFHLRGGSISGHGRAKLHSGTGRYESFGGSATISGGTGRYAHISGSGGFYGVLDRRSYNAEVQVIGKLRT
jgi:hypothetical protein